MSQFDLENEVNSALKMDAPLTRGPLMRWQKHNSESVNLSLNSSVLSTANKTPMKLTNQVSASQSKTPSSQEMCIRKTPKSAGK